MRLHVVCGPVDASDILICGSGRQAESLRDVSPGRARTQREAWEGLGCIQNRQGWWKFEKGGR